MAREKDAAVVKELRTLFNVGAVRELSDGQLLERFATDRGEAAELAFAVLVERHGAMVLRVCRSTLADAHDTEDAFQATFLVLAQKARGLWVRDSLGPWLHQVAFRTAARGDWNQSGGDGTKRGRRLLEEEKPAMNGDELGALLHEEIGRLPERFRGALVLCDLEGQSQEQAARNLGWPVGTVKSRQARGRERLRDRLRRRGMAPNVGLLGSGQVFSGPVPAVPPALVESTTRSVVEFVTCQTAVRASTLALAQGVLKAMTFARWSKAACLLLVSCATLSGAGILALGRTPAARLQRGNAVETGGAQEPATFRAAPGKLIVTLAERGVVESARNADAFCIVEGGTTIISLVPEGTRVKKGETICELDSAGLRDQLTNAQIAVMSAEVEYQNASTDREVAEIAVTEFSEGTFARELNTLKGEVAAAQLAIQKAESRLDRASRARQRIGDLLASKKGAIAPVDILTELDIEDRVDASEQTISREKIALQLAKSKQEILEKYTRDRTIKALKVDGERKRSGEMAKNASWQLEKAKAKKLEKLIAACTIKAPVDGALVYANPPRQRRGESREMQQIEEGATVRERQKILSVIDLNGPKQVNAKLNESQIANIRPGMKAKIRVDSFPNQLFDGTVVEISALPDLPVLNEDDPRVYTTKVRVDNAIPGLRPRMTAQVEFLVANRENVLSVPVQAVVHYEGKTHVAVMKPGGGIELREVSVGVSNDKFVEITHGIESGDIVFLNPGALIK